jgi:hypothetical protein
MQAQHDLSKDLYVGFECELYAFPGAVQSQSLSKVEGVVRRAVFLDCALCSWQYCEYLRF